MKSSSTTSILPFLLLFPSIFALSLPGILQRTCSPMAPGFPSAFNSSFSSTFVAQESAQELITNYINLYENNDFELLPLALYFVGPSGVGKTETAKVLRKAMFPNKWLWKKRFLIISMQLYRTMDVWKPMELDIYNALRRCPHTGIVVVFDEFDKATLEVRKSIEPFLQPEINTKTNQIIDNRKNIFIILEELSYTETERWLRTADRNCTSDDEKHMFYRKFARDYLTEKHGTHLTGRIRDPVFFPPLGTSSVREIIRRSFTTICKKYSLVSFSEECIDYVINSAAKETNARGAITAFDEVVPDAVAVLTGHRKPGPDSHVSASRDLFVGNNPKLVVRPDGFALESWEPPTRGNNFPEYPPRGDTTKKPDL